MNIYDYLQVNSNFVYAEKLDFSFAVGLKRAKINVKKYTNTEFCALLENSIFDEKLIYIHLITKQGEFILSNATNQPPHDKVQEYLKSNSLKYKTYYFSNVDYFSFGRFGIAENGKLVRYLAYNCEATDDEDIVVWIGKPHDWEYSTHTFYTKKKLEDCEMCFDTESVCDMIDYYLPFVDGELDILSCYMYCEDKVHMATIQKNAKKIRKHSNNKLNKNDLKNVHNFLQGNNASNFSFILRVSNNKIVVDSQFVYVYNPDDALENQKVLANFNTNYILYRLIDKPEELFNESIIESVRLINTSKTISVYSFMENKTKFDGYINYLMIVPFLSPTKIYVYLIRPGIGDQSDTKMLIGNKLNNQTIYKIYHTILSWYNEDSNKNPPA